MTGGGRLFQAADHRSSGLPWNTDTANAGRQAYLKLPARGAWIGATLASILRQRVQHALECEVSIAVHYLSAYFGPAALLADVQCNPAVVSHVGGYVIARIGGE